MTRKSIATNPWMDELVAQVQKHLQHSRRKTVTYSEAIAWIVGDFKWCEVDKPAFGQMSPVMAEITRRAMRNLAKQVDVAAESE